MRPLDTMNKCLVDYLKGQFGNLRLGVMSYLSRVIVLPFTVDTFQAQHAPSLKKTRDSCSFREKQCTNVDRG